MGLPGLTAMTACAPAQLISPARRPRPRRRLLMVAAAEEAALALAAPAPAVAEAPAAPDWSVSGELNLTRAQLEALEGWIGAAARVWGGRQDALHLGSGRIES